MTNGADEDGGGSSLGSRDVDSSTSLETAYEYDGEGHVYKIVGPGEETIRTSREYLEEENAEGTAVYMLLVRRLMEVSVPPSGTEWRLVSEAACERGERLFRESRFFGFS